MLPLLLRNGAAKPVRMLAIGAHPDDIEIGCGGTVVRLLEQGALGEVWWVVLSGTPERVAEARASATALLGKVPHQIIVTEFADGFFPYIGQDVKGLFERLKRDCAPDIVLTHQRDDLHQDHRLTCDLTWNTFRDHLILEYEVPKYDGDLGRPNLFVTLSDSISAQKIRHLMTYFASQASKHWFEEGLFSGLLRVRGMECKSPTSYAEAFYCRKAVLA